MEFRKTVFEAVKKAGHDLIDERPYSKHPEDAYLRIVLARKDFFGTTEYVTWVYNDSSKGLESGHYTHDLQKAVEDYYLR